MKKYLYILIIALFVVGCHKPVPTPEPEPDRVESAKERYELSYEAEHIAQCLEEGLLTSPVVTEELSAAGIRLLEAVKETW